MKQAYKQKTNSFQIRKQIKSIALVLDNAQHNAISLLLVLTLALAFLYIYFLGSAVVYAVERKEAQGNIADAKSRVADLEVNYLKKKNSITSDLATNLGFTSLSETRYITRARYLGRANTQ